MTSHVDAKSRLMSNFVFNVIKIPIFYYAKEKKTNITDACTPARAHIENQHFMAVQIWFKSKLFFYYKILYADKEYIPTENSGKANDSIS